MTRHITPEKSRRIARVLVERAGIGFTPKSRDTMKMIAGVLTSEDREEIRRALHEIGYSEGTIQYILSRTPGKAGR